VLVLAVVVWVLFVPVADWLARHDVGSTTGPLHETAVDNARARLLTLGAGLFAIGALIFTARNFTLSYQTFRLTEQGQVTERYTKAIEQLGSDKLDVRIGGIYALERIARDSPQDHPTVMEVLTAFIREHSREQWPVPERGSKPAPPQKATRPDVQAALTVVGRRDAKRDVRPVDLSRADLSRADLYRADLSRADLSRADLTGADLIYAELTAANLSNAILMGAKLTQANLTAANLTGADLTDANVAAANLTGADLTDANLTEANLTDTLLIGSDLSSANLSGANLTDAALFDANLTGANLNDARNLDSAGSLEGASWPHDAAVPAGWKRDTDDGRLRSTRLYVPDPGGKTPEAG
jgi:hypothetical protein